MGAKASTDLTSTTTDRSTNKSMAVPAFELDLFINERYGLLLFNRKSSLRQVVRETGHVRGLQQPRAKGTMHVNRRANGGFRDLVQPVPLAHGKEKSLTQRAQRNSQRAQRRKSNFSVSFSL